MRTLALLLLAVATGCQCGPVPPEVDAGPSDSGQETDGGASPTDAGAPTRLQLLMDGTPAAMTCRQGTLRALGAAGAASVRDDVRVALDGGVWVHFFDGVDCVSSEVAALTIPAGRSSVEFRYRVDAFGSLSATATELSGDAGLMPETATFTATAQVGFELARAVVPGPACAPLTVIRALAEGTTTEVVAAQPARLTLVTALPFGGSPTDGGCFNTQWDVVVPAGGARATLWVATTGTPGETRTLTLSPGLPAGLTPGTLQLPLFVQCLPTGAACDGGVEACCGVCSAGACQ